MPLEARNVFFRYHRKSPWVLENRSLTVGRGERLALLAPSGYGKTTLALLLAGYLQPARGEILWDGFRVISCEFLEFTREKEG